MFGKRLNTYKLFNSPLLNYPSYFIKLCADLSRGNLTEPVITTYTIQRQA
jgi:hypothetical protein